MERILKPTYMLVLSPEEASAEQARIAALIPPEYREDYRQGLQVVQATEATRHNQQQVDRVAGPLFALAAAAPEPLAS
jgi:hypothetical protein